MSWLGILGLAAIGVGAYLVYFHKPEDEDDYYDDEEYDDSEPIIENLDLTDEKYYIDRRYPGWYRAYEGFSTPYIPPFTGPFWPYTKTPQPPLLPRYSVPPLDVPQVPVYPF